MKVLVVNADCITVNSSANLCHLAYIKGLIDNGIEVTLLSADGKDYDTDESMQIPKAVKCNFFYGVSFYEKLSLRKKNEISKENVVSSAVKEKNDASYIVKCIQFAKKKVLSLYGPHGIYSTFARKAVKFCSDEKYDYVLSISTPPASHLLTYRLLKTKHIKAKHWIQIWEDPWYSDAYGFNMKDKIFKEEKRLLSFAEKVCYVSPLTLKAQQKLYPESADKMYWQPLPFYYKNEDKSECVYEKNVYGYFGDYVPAARDLEPFYKAAKECDIEVNICGNPSNLFKSTDRIHIHPRLPLGELKPIEDQTNVLIFLCNRKGGQIPGKIYQYSATKKTILFILDGTDEEKKVLKEYFSVFDRYVFCENTVEDIRRAISEIESGNFGNVKNNPIDEFEPTKTIQKVLEG